MEQNSSKNDLVNKNDNSKDNSTVVFVDKDSSDKDTKNVEDSSSKEDELIFDDVLESQEVIFEDSEEEEQEDEDEGMDSDGPLVHGVDCNCR